MSCDKAAKERHAAETNMASSELSCSILSDGWHVVDAPPDTNILVDVSKVRLLGIPPLLKAKSVIDRWQYIVRHAFRVRFLQRLYGNLGNHIKEPLVNANQSLRIQKQRRLWWNLQPYTSKYKYLQTVI